MRYLALAVDYDGTIATHGTVDEPTLDALRRLKASNRKLLLVTGRELPDLKRVFSHLNLFDLVVAENGALLYFPARDRDKPLAPPLPEGFIAALRRRGVDRISVGRVIVATWEPHQTAVLEAIRECGLELHVIFNKGAVMVLPSGLNKAVGLCAALRELHLSPHNVVGIGDAENDHAFLEICECAAAVANALPAVKERADVVTASPHGQGVAELIEMLLRDDLQAVEPQLERHHLALGTRTDGTPVRIAPYGVNVLIAGTSGGGKSTLVSSFLERLCEQEYQACIVDPEGDYTEFDDLLVFGDADRAPSVEEVLKALEHPEESVSVNLVGLRREDRPGFLEKLLPGLQGLRARLGHPHWIILDEAHHLQPVDRESVRLVVPEDLQGVMFATVHPRRLSTAVLAKVDWLLALGEAPDETVRDFCRALSREAPALPAGPLATGEVLAWCTKAGEPFVFRSTPPKHERRRHVRKYAHGKLAPDFSFYFEGPEKKLRLRAQNLELFLQLAEGVDDGTWLHHLRRGDYSRWFREHIKDEELAAAAERIERDPGLSADASRESMRKEIEDRYTAPT